MIGPDWERRRYELEEEIRAKLLSVQWITDVEYNNNRIQRLEDSKNVRLDYEISAEVMAQLDQNSGDFPYWQSPRSSGFLNQTIIPKPIQEILVETFVSDFIELVIDGDTNSDDGLLKILDGEKKFGVPFLSVDFGPVLWYADYRIARDTYQITCYTTIRTVK